MKKPVGDMFKLSLRDMNWRLITIILLLIITLAAFAFIAFEIVNEKEAEFDNTVLRWLEPFSSDASKNFMKVFTYFGASVFLFPAFFIIIGILIYKKRYAYAVNIAIMAFSSIALVKGIKIIFQRARPEQPYIEEISNYSFPSGHTVMVFVFFSLLTYITWKSEVADWIKISLSVLLFCVAMLVGISRIVLGVHFPSDVVAGFSLACAWTIICSFILARANKMQ